MHDKFDANDDDVQICRECCGQSYKALYDRNLRL